MSRETDAYASLALPYGCEPLLLACALESLEHTRRASPAMGSRQGVRLWKRRFSGRLSRPIDIDHQKPSASPINQATRGGKRFARKPILVKERAQGFHRRLIKSGEKPGQG